MNASFKQANLLLIISFGIFRQACLSLFIMSQHTDKITPLDRLFLLIFEPLINKFCLYLPLLLLLYPFYFFNFITSYAFVKCCIFLSAATYLNKDIAGGRSIGKRFLGYAVVNEKDGKSPRRAICFLRNLTIIIYPAELLFGLFSPTQKMSDYFTHTKIIKAPKDNKLISSFYNDMKNIPYNDETREVFGLTVLLFLLVLFVK